MKTKKFSKRLMLNKKTVAHLDNNEMKVANGGQDPSAAGMCPTYGKASCPTVCYTIDYTDHLSDPCCAGWAC